MILLAVVISTLLWVDLRNAYTWVVLLATVGYGDHVPITMIGRLIAGMTMVVGLVLFAMPIGIISTGIVNNLHRREFNIRLCSA